MDKDNQDVHQELNKLRTRIQDTREQIMAMPGIDLSSEVQQHKLHTLREQVRTKNQLLQKYKGLCMFDIPKPSWCPWHNIKWLFWNPALNFCSLRGHLFSYFCIDWSINQPVLLFSIYI